MAHRAGKYKEIIFGAIFGLGASFIDVTMHASMEGQSWWDELFRPTQLMLVYRVLFVLLGFSLGILLWQRNRVERDSRHLAELLAELRKSVAGPTLIIHTNLQLLLTNHATELSEGALEIVQSAYDGSNSLLQTLRGNTPNDDGTAR